MSNFTANDLATLDKAIATGALEVEYNDYKVKYRSLDEMMRTRDLMNREVNGTSSKPNHTRYVTSKGL